MAELLTAVGIWAVVLTLGMYQLGLWIQKKTGLALCNPILIAAAAVILGAGWEGCLGTLGYVLLWMAAAVLAVGVALW